MNQRLLISVATAALIAGTGFASAQGTMGREAPSGGSVQQNAPSTQGGSQTTPTQRNSPSMSKDSMSNDRAPGTKSTQSEDRIQKGDRPNRSAQDNEMKRDKAKDQKSARDNMKGDKDKSAADDDRSQKNQMGADEQRRNNRMGADEQRRGKDAAETQRSGGKSETVGQAGAGAKLSTEQRTRITNVIREQKVEPVTNVNFSISVGTRVPRSVHFHPLPAEIVTIYPAWRGYEFFLVRDEIVVVNPRTLEIVAVLPV